MFYLYCPIYLNYGPLSLWLTGILSSDNTCCSKSCGQCGGEGCSSLPGGESEVSLCQLTELFTHDESKSILIIYVYFSQVLCRNHTRQGLWKRKQRRGEISKSLWRGFAIVRTSSTQLVLRHRLPVLIGKQVVWITRQEKNGIVDLEIIRLFIEMQLSIH